MGMQTDVTSASRTTTGTLISGRARLKGLVITCGATAGSVVFRDGGATGTVRLSIVTPAAAGIRDIGIPDQGILFQTDIHVTISNVDGVVGFYA